MQNKNNYKKFKLWTKAQVKTKHERQGKTQKASQGRRHTAFEQSDKGNRERRDLIHGGSAGKHKAGASQKGNQRRRDRNEGRMCKEQRDER